MRSILFTLLMVAGPIHFLLSQTFETNWRPLNAAEANQLKAKQEALPWQKTFNFHLDLASLQAVLNQTFTQKTNKQPIISLPLGEKRVAKFRISSSPIIPESLAKKYPSIQTYKAVSVDGLAHTARLSWTSKGFHAIIGSPEGTYFIDPHPNGQKNQYISYNIRNNIKPGHGFKLHCALSDTKSDYNGALENEMMRMFFEARPEKSNTLPLRKYIIAVAATGEYTAYHGGTVEKALEAIVILVNRLNQVMERDMGITFELPEDNDQIIFLDSATDPYSNGDANAMLSENANYLSVAFGAQKYDLGHVVGTNTSLNGIANTGVVCVNTVQKAGGVSTMPNPEGDPFAIAIFGHEVGHQFGATHSFNSCHNIFQPTSYEPGGGTTIMSYAGICSNSVNNLQNTADDYFHTVSLQQMLFLTRNGSARSCAELVPTSNLAPEIFIPQKSGFYIPISTPFKLVAEATDPNPDSLTYCWEQFDLGPVNSPPGSPSGNSPLFRSLPPSPSAIRYFPDLAKVVEKEFDRSEVLPTYDRNMTFRCTVRDNNPESGAVDWDDVSFMSTSTAGPFQVMTPSQAGIQWKVGELREIKWDVANTDNELVNSQYVNILLSTDGGQNFDRVLVENTPNDGSAMIVIPNKITQTARIMVEAADNIFYAVSDFNFEIWPPSSPTYFLNISPAAIPQVCLPEPAEYTIQYGSLMGFQDQISFNLIGDLPKETVVEFSNVNVIPQEELSEVQLKIYINEVVNDTFDLQVQITNPGIDTSYRDIRLITRAFDYSSLAQLEPSEGSRGVLPQLVDFSWTDVPDASSYTFELATNPAFGDSIIYSESQLNDTTLRIENLLAPNTIYYWRIRGDNPICGSGNFTEAQAFQTISSSCRTYDANDVPINISGTGRPTIESTITVPEGGAIEDLNVPLIDVNYQPIKSLRFTLVSPEGQEAVLYDQDCGNTLRFLSGFDDEANEEISCPPDDGLPFKPVDSLMQYIGVTAAGDWTLRVQVVESGFGASGGLSKWSIEFCSELNPTAPSLLVNDTLKTAPGITRVIDNSLLLFDDQKFSDSDLKYVLLSVPDNGDLLLGTTILEVGDYFTQEEINGGLLNYESIDNGIKEDDFSFIVSNPEGGWVDKQQFDILIDDSFLSNVNDIEDQISLNVFPNPVNLELNIHMNLEQFGLSSLQIFDPLGREVFQQNLAGSGQENLIVSTFNWSNGIYFLQIRNEDGIANKKVIVSHH